jgi:hypothetical protein
LQEYVLVYSFLENQLVAAKMFHGYQKIFHLYSYILSICKKTEMYSLFFCISASSYTFTKNILICIFNASAFLHGEQISVFVNVVHSLADYVCKLWLHQLELNHSDVWGIHVV